MQLGVVFPQTEIGADPAAVLDYAQAAESLGYQHLVVIEHVLGADASQHPGWKGPYTHTDLFHEPFVLLGYLAGITETIELATGVVVLGQRQTALVAKQAAAVDVLSGGRVRLGVGVGWNPVEYQALGENFHNRGRRCAEQVALMRALWTQEVVNFEGRYHRVTHAGINPLPVQRPIPVWMGGGADAVVRRIAETADGWFPMFQPDQRGQERVGQMREYAKEAGRDPMSIGIEGWISFGGPALRHTQDPDGWQKAASDWTKAGATHLSLNTMHAGFTSPDQHIDALRRFKEAVSV